MAHASGRHLLQIPGPTNVPGRVLRAIEKPTIDHRGPEFRGLAHDDRLRQPGVQATDEDLGLQGGRCGEGGNLAPGVDAGVCPAGERDAHGLAGKLLESRFQLSLDGRGALLELGAVVRSAVIL